MAEKKEGSETAKSKRESKSHQDAVGDLKQAACKKPRQHDTAKKILHGGVGEIPVNVRDW